MQNTEELLYRVRQTLIDDRNLLVNKPFVLFRPITLYKISVIDKAIDMVDIQIRINREINIVDNKSDKWTYGLNGWEYESVSKKEGDPG